MQFTVLGFRVLGPVVVHRPKPSGPGEIAPIGAPMLRLLLATLLSRPNQAVGVDTLIDTIWNGQQVPNARQKLQVHVHRLRQALGEPERIGFDNSAYTLAVQPGELDAEVFETLLDEAALVARGNDWDQAATLIRQAMDLWQGDPYCELDDSPQLRAEAERLIERRLAGFEELFTAELARGRHAVVTAELKGIAERHPLRERLQELLILALYRSGRQADALAAYRRTRDALVEGLGVEPGPSLTTLQASILAADPALEPTVTAAAPAQLPAAIADFTGRSDQLDGVRQLLASDGILPVVAISGPPGVGKTTLAVRAAHDVKDQYPDGQLYVDLRGADDGPLDPAEVLARLLRALGVAGAAIPDSLDERAALYRSRLAGTRILILLDNAAAEQQIRPLIPGTPGCAVLVTSRARLAGLDGARLIDLDLFETSQAIELLGRVIGSARVAAEPDAAKEIVELCDHLPLAVRIAAARLSARQHWPLSRLAARLADERRRLDELRLGDLAVRASLTLSYNALDPLPRRAFRRLGLLNVPTFAAWVVAAVLDTSIAEAETVVDQLVDAKLLEPVGTGEPRYRFHDLVRLYARERADEDESETEQLAAIGRAVDGLLGLARQATAGMDDSLTGLAPGGSRFELPEAVRDELLADPFAWLDKERAALVAAVDQAAATGQDAAACELADTLTWYLDVRGYFDDWRRTHQTALAAAERLGLRRVEGAILSKLAHFSLTLDRYDEGWALLDKAGAAFDSVGDARGRAEVRYRSGMLSRASGEPEEAQRILNVAVTMFRKLRDPRGEASALQEIGATYLDRGRGGDARPYLERSLTMFRMLGDRRNEALNLRWIGAAERREGNVEPAGRWLAKSCEIFGQLGDLHNLAYVYGDLGRLRLDQERWPEAETLIARSLADFRTFGDRHGQARALHDLGLVHLATGTLDRATACLTKALAIWTDLNTPLYKVRTLRTLEEVYTATGQLAAAQEAHREADRVTSTEACSA